MELDLFSVLTLDSEPFGVLRSAKYPCRPRYWQVNAFYWHNDWEEVGGKLNLVRLNLKKNYFTLIRRLS